MTDGAATAFLATASAHAGLLARLLGVDKLRTVLAFAAAAIAFAALLT